MQANSQHSGQLQNLHGEGATGGNRTDQKFYQLCLPPRTASPSYSGQTGNYFTCTVQPPTSDQILVSGVQPTDATKLAQENPLNSNHTLPTVKQDSQIILWNMPSNCQIILPVTNINLQGAPNNNGPNMSHRAFNSTNGLYMHQQTTSSSVGPNNLQQFKTIDTQNRNEARINANKSNFHSRQHYANAPAKLPIESSKKRTILPSDQNYCPPPENAHHGPSSLFGGYLYQLLLPETSNNANGQMLSTSAQNLQMSNTVQKAVAVVTPLSPIGTVPDNVIDKSANVQVTIHHQPNIPPPLATNTNLMNQSGQPNDLSSKHQQPQSAVPGLNDGLCSIVGAKSPVLATVSSQNLKCAEQNKSVPVQMQNEPAEKMNKNCTITEKKSVDPDTVPFIEWPLDRLKTLISMIEQIEKVDHKNLYKNDPGKEILKLYWNGDSTKFTEAAESGIYLSIMEEVYVCSPMNEPVILRQIVNDARSKVIKDFHVLKHNEVPPKMTYTSSWLNLNENVDDIDKECGYSWFYKSFQNFPEHEAQNLACEQPSSLQEATDKPSLSRTKQLPSEVEKKAPADQPTSNNSLHDNGHVSFNGQSLPVANINCSPKYSCRIASSQTVITHSLEAVVDLDEQGVPAGKSKQLGTKSVVSPKSTSQSDYTNSPNTIHVVAEQQEIQPSSHMQVGSSQKMLENDSAILDQNVRCKTTPTPSQEPPVHMNDVETDQTDASATKINVLPHEMARRCFVNEVKGHKVIAEFPDKREATLNTPHVLDTVSTEESIGRQKLEEMLKYSASTRQALIPAQCNQITEKVQDKQISSEKNICSEIYEKSPVPLNAESPPVIDNVFLKLNDQQPNAVNPLKGIKSLMRTLERPNVSLKYKSLFKKHSDLKKHKPLSRLDNSFAKSVRSQSPVVIDESSCQSDCTIDASTPSPVAKTQEFVPISQAQNESMMNVYQELSAQINKKVVELAKDTTCRLNDALSSQLKSSVFAHGSTRQTDYASPPKLHPVLTGPSQMQNESDEEMPEIDCALSEESVRCETDPKPIQELFVNVNEEESIELDDSASIKINVLPHQVAKQWFAGQLVQDEDTVASPVFQSKKVCPLNSMTHLVRAIGKPDIMENASPPTLHPVLAEPSRVQSDEEMPKIDCVLTDKNVRCDSDPKPDQEFPVEMDEEEIGGLDTSVCIKINVLPHEVAMQCFAGQIMEDKDIAISTEEQTNMWKLEGTEGSTSTCASPPKLDPVIKESPQVLNESSEEMPEIDCMLTGETDPKPSKKPPGNISEAEAVNTDGLVSIKINVLPHEMAQLWFKDVKSEEGKYLSSGGESLESYCCLAKWCQTLEHGNHSLCMCQIKAELRKEENKIEANRSLEAQAEKESLGECERVETDDTGVTEDSEDENPLLHDPTTDKTKNLKDMSSSKKVFKAETETSEQKRSESPTESTTNMTRTNETEQDTPAPYLKKSNTVCLALFGSSSEKGSRLKRTKRCKETSIFEEPPKTLKITISSQLKVKNKNESMKRKCVEPEEDQDATDRKRRKQRASLQNLVRRKSMPSLPVSGLCKNGLSSTSVRQLPSQSGNVKSDVHLAEGNEGKRSHKHITQQMSMNKYIIRGKSLSSKLLRSPENVKKSKYELGNPALMPLDKGPALEFKVLPETFNFEDAAELQADTSQIMQNEMLGSEEKNEKMETSHVPTQGVWSFNPLKKKCTQPIQDTDVSGSCSLFQEFKKKYREKKDIAFKQNLNSSERT